MSIDEARRVMRDLFSVPEIVRIEALIDAKLSPAPVGTTRPKCNCTPDGRARECDCDTGPGFTPPAATSDGGEALERWNYDRTKGVLEPNPHGYWTNWRIAADRIAALEQGLAEAERENAWLIECNGRSSVRAEGADDRAETTERQRDEATALVERLREVCRDLVMDIPWWSLAIANTGAQTISMTKYLHRLRALLSEPKASEGAKP